MHALVTSTSFAKPLRLQHGARRMGVVAGRNELGFAIDHRLEKQFWEGCRFAGHDSAFHSSARKAAQTSVQGTKPVATIHTSSWTN